MSKKLFNENTILINADFQNQAAVFDYLGQNSAQQGWISDSDLIIAALKEREALGTTGFENGIAIPHCRVAGLSEPKIYFIKLKNGIDWQAMDGQPTKYIFSILVPQSEEAGNQHLEILAKLSTGLMDEKVVSSLKTINSVNEAQAFLSQVLFTEPENETSVQEPSLSSDKPFYVAISACTFGLSHTYMVEKKLQIYAQEHNLEIKVETHGSKGDLNIITSEDLKRAQGVLIAVDKELDLRDLPNHANVYKTTTAEVLKNPALGFAYLTGAKKQNLMQSELKNLFKIKLPRNFMQTANGMLTFSQWLILLAGFLFLISFGFGADNQFFNDAFLYLRYASVGVAAVAGFWLVFTFTKSKTTAGSYAFLILIFNVKLLIENSTSSGLGIFTALILLFIPLLYEKAIYHYLKKWLKPWAKLRGGVHWIAQLSFVVVMFVTLYYSHVWFSGVNHKIWQSILTWDASYWWFRWGIACLFMGLMVIDMGGPVNKASIIISAILFADSFAANITGSSNFQPNVFATPLTAQVVGITIPGISLWVRSLMMGKKLDQEEILLCQESGKKAFSGISEHALWTYQYYKNWALPAHLLNVLGCSLIIGLLHIQYFGGYNTMLGAIFGLSFDNVLSNQYFSVMPQGMPSFNLGFLILNTVGPIWGGLVYSGLFQKRFKAVLKTI